MEPVALRRPDRALLGFLLVFIAVPFLLYIVQSFFHFEWSSLSPIFFKLLTRSIFFGLSQAFLSALGACALALLLAVATLSLFPRHRAYAERFLRVLGQLLFVIPGTSIALLVLSGQEALAATPGGWTLIVVAHILWATFFIASQIVDRGADWLEFEGADLLRAARTLGASHSAAFAKVAAPFLTYELRAWFPLIFLWSFGSFSTVLLLGHGPQHSTPEVLLYYTLLNDLDSSRLLVLFFVTFTLQSLLIRKVIGASPKSLHFATPPASLDVHKNHQQRLVVKFSVLWQLLALILVSAVSALLLGYLVGIVRGPLPDFLLWTGLGFSWSYALLSSVLVFAFLLLGAAVRSQTRRKTFYLLAVSPVLLATAWKQLPFVSDQSLSTSAALGLCGLGLALLQVPFAFFWMDRSLSALDPRLALYAQSVGLSRLQVFWKIEVPYLRPVFEKILTYVFCLALGEIALVSIWLREQPLLSLLARRLAQSYDFHSASWVFVLTIASALLARFLFSQSLRRVFP